MKKHFSMLMLIILLAACKKEKATAPDMPDANRSLSIVSSKHVKTPGNFKPDDPPYIKIQTVFLYTSYQNEFDFVLGYGVISIGGGLSIGKIKLDITSHGGTGHTVKGIDGTLKGTIKDGVITITWQITDTYEIPVHDWGPIHNETVNDVILVTYVNNQITGTQTTTYTPLAGSHH